MRRVIPLAFMLVLALVPAVDLRGAAQEAAQQAPAAEPAAEELPRPVLEDFMSPLVISPGLRVSVVHLNDGTTEIIFQPPQFYAMRAQARQARMFLVQGTPSSGVDFDPTLFRLEQNGQSVAGQAINITNFEKKRVPANQRIDGILRFETALDLSMPFRVTYGSAAADFAFDELRMLIAMPPVAGQ